jgi:tRNA (adenine57-N1/adenine58-N1)-methyltransferase catalytic subunit
MNFKKVLLRLPRKVKDGERDVIMNSLEEYYITESRDFHFDGGVVKKELLEKEGAFTIGKDNFVVINATFIDEFYHMKRKAQVITPKDIGPIIAYTGITRNSKIIDAGVGSGFLACFLGMVASSVDSYDVEESHIEVAEKNVKSLKLDNVKIEKKSIYEPENFENNKYDVFTLDVPEPWRALDTAKKVLKVGGYLVIYAPNINQIHHTITSLPEELLHDKTIEMIEREWSVKEKVLRPITKDFGHTAFLSFVRKIKD